MSFDYQSMDRKYEVLTGNQISDMPGSYRYNFSEIRKLPCVRLSQIDAGSLKLNDVRDWSRRTLAIIGFTSGINFISKIRKMQLYLR